MHKQTAYNFTTVKPWEAPQDMTEKSLPADPLPHPDTAQARQLKSTMGQTWLHNVNANLWSDQYGFSILKVQGREKPYQMEKGGVFLGVFYRLETAKLVSTILINDTILHKNKPEQDDQEIF